MCLCHVPLSCNFLPVEHLRRLGDGAALLKECTGNGVHGPPERTGVGGTVVDTGAAGDAGLPPHLLGRAFRDGVGGAERHTQAASGATLIRRWL